MADRLSETKRKFEGWFGIPGPAAFAMPSVSPRQSPAADKHRFLCPRKFATPALHGTDGSSARCSALIATILENDCTISKKARNFSGFRVQQTAVFSVYLKEEPMFLHGSQNHGFHRIGKPHFMFGKRGRTR